MVEMPLLEIKTEKETKAWQNFQSLSIKQLSGWSPAHQGSPV
jgi:hypothetical protein